MPEEAESAAAQLPLDDDERALAEVFARARTWDICAVHDVDAATRVTGYAPDELVPFLDLGTCKLILKQPGGPNQWELTISIAEMRPAEGGAPIAVGSTQLPQVGRVSEATCSYSYPIGPRGGDPWGIEVTGANVLAERPPCDVTRDYVTAIARRLVSPPRHGDGRTNPALALGGTDPCGIVADLVPVLPGDAPVSMADSRAHVSGPYECDIALRVNAGTPQVADVRAAVALSVSTDVIAGVDVAGRPAIHQLLGNDCTLTVRASDVEVPGNPGRPPTHEVIVVTSACDRVQRVAEAAVQALGRPTPPRPAEGAAVIGDLNPPPRPEQVGAPFDPCTVVGWDAYPPELRPVPDRRPVPIAVGPDSGFAIGCSFNSGPMFSSLVWGSPTGAFSADPAARPGSVPAQFGPKPGVEQGSSAEGQPVCYSAVQLANGIAAVSTVVPGGNPCLINRTVLEQVAGRVP